MRWFVMHEQNKVVHMESRKRRDFMIEMLLAAEKEARQIVNAAKAGKTLKPYYCLHFIISVAF